MRSIDKISVVNKEKLNGEFYFQSLLEEAYALQIITDADVERIQFECLELLASKTERYNSGHSSSIRVELAQSIMTSNLYTIGLWLKSYQNADDAVNALKGTAISDLYANGRKRIDTMLKTTKFLHRKVLENMIETENVFYNETIVGGINGFFKIYNPDFEAHEIHITVDYLPFIPIKNLAGIEFIKKYLEVIYYENTLCRNFLPSDIHHLLCGMNTDYQDMPFNLYEPVLTAAIGCVLTWEDARNLNMTEMGISYLGGLLKDKSDDEISAIILAAFNKLKRIFPPANDSQERYIKASLQAITIRVSNSVRLNTIDKVFHIAKHSENNTKLHFSYGDKMDNELYRNVLCEIMQCRYLSDKITIIKQQLHSLADLEDVLLDAGLSSHEITGVLHELSPPEIVALSKKYPFKPDIEAIELREHERTLSKCLNDFVTSLPENQQTWISKAVDMLDINF